MDKINETRRRKFVKVQKNKTPDSKTVKKPPEDWKEKQLTKDRKTPVDNSKNLKGVLNKKPGSEGNELVEGGSLTLDEYDYNPEPDSMCLVIGKRRYGKTTWAQYLLSLIWPYFLDGGYVFTDTKQNYFWQQHFPENRVYEGVQQEVLSEILSTQKAKYNAMMDGEDVGIPFIVIIFDDVISDESQLRFNPLLNEIVFSGRHFFIFCIMCIQDAKGVGPKVRGNADIIALTYQTQGRSVKTIQDDFAKFFDDNDMFMQMLTENTQDHEMIIIDQATAKYNVRDAFHKTLAEEKPEEYKIGNDKFWEEAGNIWKDQLKKAKNKVKHDKDEWMALAKKRVAKESKLKREREESDGDPRVETNQKAFAPKSEGDEKKKPPESVVEKVQKMQNRLAQYRPPKKSKYDSDNQRH